MDKIDPRVIAKAKMVTDDEVTIDGVTQAIEERLGVNKQAALQFLIEAIVQNPELKFYNKVAKFIPYGNSKKPIIRCYPISNAVIEMQLRLMERSGLKVVKKNSPVTPSS